MKFTNRHKISKELVHWLKADDYDYNPNPKVFSATTLMKPTRMVVLEQRWKDDMTIDVSDLIASRYGTSLHDSFEKCDIPNTIQEVRYYRKVGKYTVSGKVDLLLNIDQDVWTVADIKSTSVWNYILNKKDDVYRQQLSIYKWLIADGYYIKDGEEHRIQQETQPYAEVKFLFTDWSKKDSIIKKDYPQARVNEKQIDLYSLDETQEYIEGKLSAIEDCLDLPDNALPYCKKDELWQAGSTTYAVKKAGAKRAIKVYDNLNQAMGHKSSKPELFIETRYPKAKRCHYCNVRQFCNQYEQLLSENLID